MSVPDKVKVIGGDAAEISVSVGADGVCLGFFAKDGRSVCVNLDKISAALPKDSDAALALATWASDRRDQAAHIAG